MRESFLLEQADMLDPSRVPAWVTHEYRNFHEQVIAPGFPCHFGAMAEKNKELRYTCLKWNDLINLPATLEEFLHLSRSNPKARHNLTVFFEPEQDEKSFDFYQNRFWEVLNFLHKHDPKPWPQNVPRHPDDPLWEFCFDGEPFFLFTSSPAYKQRKSRNYGNCLMILFQPKRVFVGIESETSNGMKARHAIRSRLKVWDDGIELHPDMINPGEILTHRWKLYAFSDDDTPATGTCPFSHD